MDLEDLKVSSANIPEQVELQHDLLTTNYTKIYHEKEYKFNSPHHFVVGYDSINSDGDFDGFIDLCVVDFQEGPIKENGINGIHNEDLIHMVIARLEGFQNSEYKCRENAVAITKLEEAVMWLRRRTNKRVKRGVEGTSTV